jgi:hypothetical protein
MNVLMKTSRAGHSTPDALAQIILKPANGSLFHVAELATYRHNGAGLARIRAPL